MHANHSSPTNKNAVSDISVDLHPFIRQYKDGHIERLLHSPFVLASENPAANRGVATRDVVIDQETGVSARLFLPSRSVASGRRLPLVMYIHGGSFCTESAFCRTYHRYVTSLAACAGALVVSVEYHLAPENPIPAAYDDAWAALQWVAALSDPWLADHADPRRMFLAGDSAGGNIAYHTAVRASRDASAIDIEGMVIVHPYFWGAERLPSEVAWDGVAIFPPDFVDKLWPFVTMGQAGNDDPRINPPDEEIASLRCQRVLVAVAEKDILRDRGCWLATRMHDCKLISNNVTLVESEGEDHGFHLYNPLRATSKKLMESIVQFINQCPTSPSLKTMLPEQQGCSTLHTYEGRTKKYWALSMPTRPFKAILGDGLDMKDKSGPICMATGSLKIEWEKAHKTSYGLFLGRVRPNKAYRGQLSTTLLESSVIKNYF